MPSGTPDFGAKLPTDISVSAIDMGELAVRLRDGFGSFYRGGSYVFADGFENGLPSWDLAYILGGTADLDFSTDQNTHSGLASLKLYTPAVNGAGVNVTHVLRSYPTKMGVEFLLKMNRSGSETIDIFLLWVRASNLFSSSINASIRIDGATRTISTREDIAGVPTWVNVLNIPTLASGDFHTVKFTADFIANTYGHLWIDYLDIDLTGHTPSANSPAGANSGMSLSVIFSIHNTSGVLDKTFWFDNIIVTKDEPV